ncbi:MAG: GNAT family N-acetyltransferase [Actinobacteria bacterium]|nr:GNAT family N-acetyltransferase [Actinomycetota bacterium]
MRERTTFREMAAGDEGAASALIEDVFDEFIAPDYGPGGVEEFKKHILPEDLLQRQLNGDSFIILAEEDGEVVGVIDVRDGCHIRLFFVRKDRQGRGIGRGLFSLALERCTGDNPELEEITVNSSPYAIPIYESMGFFATRPELVRNGIRHIPMAYRVMRG